MRRTDSNTLKRMTAPNVGGGRMRERCESGGTARGILEGFGGGRLTEKFEFARAGCRWIAAMSLDQTDLQALPASFRQQPRGL